MSRPDELKIASGVLMLVIAIGAFVMPFVYFLGVAPLGAFISGYLSGKSDEMRRHDSRKELARGKL